MSEHDDFWRRLETVTALEAWIDAALKEDRADHDVTTEALFHDFSGIRALASITAGVEGVFCGGPAAIAVFRQVDPTVVVHTCATEGTALAAGDEALSVEASISGVLAAERTALNILGLLGGVATRTREWAQVAGTVQVLDTRKTVPGLRNFQKYAVRVGGGVNHRSDLAAEVLVKENHRDLLRGALGLGDDRATEIGEVVSRVRSRFPELPLEIEVEDLESFLACVQHKVDAVLLDNQEPSVIAEWLRTAQEQFGRLPRILEASGGIEADRLAAYAACGVTRVSMGALTHSVRNLDLSLHVTWKPTE